MPYNIRSYIIYRYVGQIILVTFLCQISIVYFLPDADVLGHHCDVFFVALVMPFNYEDKRVAHNWPTHNQRIRWPVTCTTQSVNMWRRQTF